MTHDNTTLTVSEKEATRVEEDAKRRLLASRRLSLVVDLDQTIIHATVDPTVGEWKDDKDNPNYEALKDVRSFQLVDDTPGARGCWYYIKLRPGLEEFLEKVAELYELHIYTMGTRAYAQNIADLIDPTRKLFGDRILSRDESGSLTAKNLQRLFPVDTKMVVIIDDRGDVWRWIPNLIKVVPYDFFVGIGDINSSFLPKKQEIAVTPKVKGPKEKATQKELQEHHVNGATMKTGSETEVSALEQLVTMGGGDDPRLLQEQTDAQEETLMHQVEDRPLLQKQKELDADDDASADGSESSSSGDESQETARPRHHLLVDHDNELFQLRDRLQAVHKIFFEEYDKKRTHALGGRVAALRGEKAASKDKDVDLKLVPDIKDIMPLYKAQVLGGVVIVFSGVIPLGQDLQNAEVSLWAKTFGVVVLKNIDKRVTHLVAGRNRTAKVREATRWPNVKIVTTQWLYDSLINWNHLDEEPYLLPVHPDDRGEPLSPGSRELADSSWISSSDEATNATDDDASDDIFKDAGLTESSPLSYDEDDQAAVHDELKEFLGSDDESESDSEFWTEESAEPSRKRKRGEGNEGNPDDELTDEDADDADTKGSRLSQRIKRSYERSTGLREVATAGGLETEETRFEKGSFPAPDDDDEGDEVGDNTAVGEQEQEEQSDTAVNESDADEFEREFMAAFEEPDPIPPSGADETSTEQS